MKMSVVISTYNGEKYIEDEMKSILNQTRKPDEVLIFDDVSTDQTLNICRDFIEENELNNWSIVKNDKNKGWRRNFMEGISNASGEVIFIADQDDIWAKNKVEIMAKIMESDEKVLLLTSNFISFTTEQPNIQELSECEDIQVIDPKKKFFPMEQPGCTYCIRKSLFEEAYKIWQPDFAHDAILWRVAAVKNGIRKVKNNLHYWRRHLDSTFSVESKTARNREDRRKSLELLSCYVNKIQGINGIDSEWVNSLEFNSKWIEKRKKMYDQRSILIGISLLGSLSKYRDFRQYLADLYLALLR